MTDSTPTLLALPPELRLTIYEYIWIPLPTQITSAGLVPPRCLVSSSALNLLLVCKALYHEARHTAYTRHTFSLTRNLDTYPLAHEPRLAPYAYITSLVILGYRPPSPDQPSRCYTFKEICTLVRRFKNLHTLVILTDELAQVEKGLRSRKAHVGYRLRKARLLQDERFVPTYNLFGLDGRVQRRWRLTVAGSGKEEEGRVADLVLCGIVV